MTAPRYPFERRVGFRLELDDDIVRTLTRAEYYAAKSWLRHCRRMIAMEMEKTEYFQSKCAKQVDPDQTT